MCCHLAQPSICSFINMTPPVKDLYEHITPHYATYWKVMGVLLGIPRGELEIIDHDHYHKAVPCCNAMLEKWLDTDVTATWNKLIRVIQSNAVSASVSVNLLPPEKGVEAVSTLSNRVAMLNAQAQQSVDEETWPPDQPKNFIPLVLIHHQEQRTQEQYAEMSRLIQKGVIDSVVGSQSASKSDNQDTIQHVVNTSVVTKKVADILTPLEKGDNQKLILIEGAPGIGKSVLLKHIAIAWGNKMLLCMFKLVLLICLRDPSIQQVTSIRDLLQLFCKGDTKAAELSTLCSDYLLANGGKDVTFLFDGYDEFPDNLQKNSLMADIINRKVLPLCGLVVSSRPHASVKLRKRAAVRVEILGFAEEERRHYIEQALDGQPFKISELTQYLYHHPTIGNLCFVPFNMSVLLYLYNLGISLPRNSAELYDHFIYQTICRHLVKSGEPGLHIANQTSLANLPEPYNTIIKQLSMLSLKGLNDNRLVFTYDDIKEMCPDIIATPGAINGYGLLQAVQHFGLTRKMMTFHFLHLTIQEYLGAHYIIKNLPPDKQLQLLREKFWSDLHAGVFSIYIALTKGQQPSFKYFLCGGDSKITIADEFLVHRIKCLRLFACFHEAGDNKMCRSIEEAAVLQRKEIDLRKIRLSPSDVECVSLFLTSSSHNRFLELNLDHCYIQDHGLRIIHKSLIASGDITIGTLGLVNNGLTVSSSSRISDIVLVCKVRRFWIAGNHKIGENEALYTILSNPLSTLTYLNMSYTSLSSIAARKLFAAVMNAGKLEVLDISNNAITDETVCDIKRALNSTASLTWLALDGNPIGSEAVLKIVQALYANTTLTCLWLSLCSLKIEERITLLQNEINKMRERQGINQLLKISFKTDGL
ncbi:protein NLRC5-like isoform X2 [Dysidea avara]|uniref:protein NLRC5-like isoform X2 n=1 Tax=Dysidea avara TaxID=196820 RepID=UPI003333AE14